MPQLRGFGASIMVDGVRLEEFRVTRDGSQVTSFIVGDPGKVFALGWTAASNPTGACTFLEFDGARIAGQYRKGATTTIMNSAPSQGISQFVFRKPGTLFQPGCIHVYVVRVHVPEAPANSLKRKQMKDSSALDWKTASPVDISDDDPPKVVSYVRFRFLYIPSERLNTLLQQVPANINLEFGAQQPLEPEGSASTQQARLDRGRHAISPVGSASAVVLEQNSEAQRSRKKRRSSPKENMNFTALATSSNSVYQGPAIAGSSRQMPMRRDYSPKAGPVIHGLADMSIADAPHTAMDFLQNSSPPSIEASTEPSTPAPEEPLQNLSKLHLQSSHNLEECQDAEFGRAASLPPSFGHSRPGGAHLAQKRAVSSIVPRVSGNTLPAMDSQTTNATQPYAHGITPDGQGPVVGSQFGEDYLISPPSDYVHDMSSYLPANSLLDQYNPYDFSLTTDYLTDFSTSYPGGTPGYPQGFYDMDTSDTTANY